MTNRTKIIKANSLHTVESLRRWASCCFSQPVSRMLATALEWLTDFLTGGDYGKPKSDKIKGRCQPPLLGILLNFSFPFVFEGCILLTLKCETLVLKPTQLVWFTGGLTAFAPCFVLSKTMLFQPIRVRVITELYYKSLDGLFLDLVCRVGYYK